VEKVNPDLVVCDKEGKPYTVRYDQVNVMLLNEFLKEHREVEAQDRKTQEQNATIAQLKFGNRDSHRNGERAGGANRESERSACSEQVCAANSA
jgi:hypothetical protein